MKLYKTAIGVLLMATVVSSCHTKPSVSLDATQSALIPRPKVIKPVPNSFVIDHKTTIYTGISDEVYAIGMELQAYIKKEIGYELTVSQTTTLDKENSIHLILLKGSSIDKPESYTIDSNEQAVFIQAVTPEGIYRGFQTFKQLLPLEAEELLEWDGKVWAIPGVQIQDEPYYEYRGAMLDVARHFFTVKDVKRYIDLLALYKINTLHLHLTDDQGWRIEIKSWPKLTEIGGSTAVGGGKGGFYSQEEYAEIIAYAAQKYITIIPEIDMPGHTNAALASYPELNCDGKATDLYTGMRVGFSSLCVDKEVTYVFIDDVIRELSALTLGDYIHLGGDESHATSKKDYNTFLQNVFPIVKKYEKKVMGWEDIESAKVDSSFILQHWTSKEKADNAASQKARIVLSPAPHTYLDMKYNDSTKLGLTWAGAIDINKGYNWIPSNILDVKYKNQIIGIESPLWSETLTTIQDIEYMAFPRIIGHAALGWNGKPADRDNYYYTLTKNLKRLDKKGVNYKR